MTCRLRPSRLLIAVAFASCLGSACAPSRSTTAPSTSSPAVGGTAPRHTWTLVALGDSYLTQPGSDGNSIVDRYAHRLEQAGVDVTLLDLSRPPTTTFSLLSEFSTPSFADAVAEGDIILVSVGGNDVDPFGLFPPGTCAPVQPKTFCLDAYAPGFADRYESIFANIERLRGSRPTAIRALGDDNPFVGWDQAPSPSFGVEFYAQVAAAETAVVCDVASRHHAACIDFMPIFGGPQGTQDPGKYLAADHGHPGDRGMDTIVDLLMKSALDPLR